MLTLDRSIVGEFVPLTGIRRFIHYQQTICGDGFTSFTVESEDIDVSDIFLDTNRGSFEKLDQALEILGHDDVGERDEKILRSSPQELLDIITMAHIVNAGREMEKSLSSFFWHGNQEVRGIYHKIERVHRCSFSDLAKVAKDLMEKQKGSMFVVFPTAAELCDLPDDVVVDGAMNDGTACILPIVVDNEPGLIEHYVDYRECRGGIVLDEAWWSDAGMFSWLILKDKWNYRMKMTTERKLELVYPELAHLIRIEEL